MLAETLRLRAALLVLALAAAAGAGAPTVDPEHARLLAMVGSWNVEQASSSSRAAR